LRRRGSSFDDRVVDELEASRRLQDGFVFDPGDPLRNLRTLTEARAALTAFEPFLVREARRGAASWDEIGQALGVSRQGAHRRHARAVNAVRRP
jgi:hypothetical protein